MFRRLPARRAPALAAALLAASLTACAGDARGEGDDLRLVASFYPLQFVTQRVAGNAAVVTSLTKPGIEPHDVELTPRKLGSVADADLVVYLKGFQSAVDDAVRAEGRGAGFDVSGPARLTRVPRDPHFWLDPTRLADVADAVASRLGEVAPERAATFTANAAALRAELTALDADFHRGLRTCVQRALVTSHAAFGYLADRYGLEQVGITGLDPEAEPSPRALAEVADFVEAEGVSTIYYETLVSPDIAQTVADETGATTAVLDPIEGITESSAGRDYFDVMRADLATLRTGQECT
jgi:zinc transport system substrate-binding protein